jgi:hypothetical protein
MLFPGLGRGGNGVIGWPVVRDPVLRPRANRRCSETPRERPRMERDDGLVC